MSDLQPILNLKLDGPKVETNRVPVDELTSLLKKVQLCVKRIGQVLSGEISSAKPGRLKRQIETACNLDVVAFNSGCFQIGLDVTPHSEQLTLGTLKPLGEAAIEKFVEGIDRLGQNDPYLVSEFDYGVLVALRDVTRILDRGVDQIEISYRGNGDGPRIARLNPHVRDRILENITGPSRSAIEIKGMLREVDLERRSCHIYPPKGRYINCRFEDRHESAIKESLDGFVIVHGEASMRESDGSIKEMKILDVESLDMPLDYLPSMTSAKPLTANSLLKSGIVGMWKKRTDIGDSSEFAVKLRERAQRRQRDN